MRLMIEDKDSNVDTTFSEWLNQNCENGNLCPPEMSDGTAVELICQYLIDDDVILSTLPINGKQMNTEIVSYILSHYSKKYKDEIFDLKYPKKKGFFNKLGRFIKRIFFN